MLDRTSFLHPLHNFSHGFLRAIPFQLKNTHTSGCRVLRFGGPNYFNPRMFFVFLHPYQTNALASPPSTHPLG